MIPTYNPNKRKRLTTHGFLERTSTKAGRSVLSRRRAKGRKKLTVSEEGKKFISHHHAPNRRKTQNLRKPNASSPQGETN